MRNLCPAEYAEDAEANKIWDSGIQDLGIDASNRQFDPILQSGSRILNPYSSIANRDIDFLRVLCVLWGENVAPASSPAAPMFIGIHSPPPRTANVTWFAEKGGSTGL